MTTNIYHGVVLTFNNENEPYLLIGICENSNEEVDNDVVDHDGKSHEEELTKYTETNPGMHVCNFK